MNGMNMNTGQIMIGEEYLRQSIWRILSTPIGERIMRPTFGSNLPELIDRPFNPATRLAMEAATSDAISRWEPTFNVEEVKIEMVEVGVVLITLTGEFEGRITTIGDIRIGRVPEDTSNIPEIPIDPSIPTIPTIPEIPITPGTPTGDTRWTTFIFGDDTFIFGDESYGWEE